MRYSLKQPIELNGDERALAKKLGLSDKFMQLLLFRGIKREDIPAYLSPSLSALSPAIEIGGMRDAVKRIKRAIQNREKILIYGDYDCDGICAISILTLYLKDKADVRYFIPERNRDGYGISVQTLERLLAARKPDLIITVDCGITACAEVEYLKSKGVDVIVTDHHEPQSELPDCVIVDEKIEKKGFFELCGAGVALRLVEALAGIEEAKKYLDIAAIATVADVVPLVGENRIIAYHGIRLLNSQTRRGIKFLFGEGKITSQDIMFKIAPRMNAAGRLDSAMKVVELFTESDYFMLKTLAEELERDNAKRQLMCEEVATEAKKMLRGADFSKTGIIILYGEKWEAGVLGIAAAKLVEEFKRPAILFASSGDGTLKGSARSVAKINIFELLSSMSELFVSFGGHSQAAGVSISLENFEKFKEEANARVLKSVSLDAFDPVTECEMLLTPDTDFLAFAKELERIEPTGHMNPKPNFLLVEDKGFERIGFSQHVKLAGKGLDVVGFSKYADSLTHKIGRVELEVGLGLNVFQNNVTAQAIVKSFEVDKVELSDEDSLLMNLHQLSQSGEAEFDRASVRDIENMLKEPFGTLLVCFSKQEYDELLAMSVKVKSLPLKVASIGALNPTNCVIICPQKDLDVGFFKQVVVCGSPLACGYLKKLADQSKVFLLEGVMTKKLKLTDNALRNIYSELYKLSLRGERYQNMRRLYLTLSSRIKVEEWAFEVAMRVFDELGLVKVSDNGTLEASRRPVRLSDSTTYQNLLH